MKELIFVCTGNTCRSPMAEALGKKILGEDLKITSRGLTASYHQGPNRKSVIAMDKEGIDIRSHIAKQFNIQEVGPDTVILGMTHSHTDYLLAYFPELKGRVHTILAYAGMEGEVADPYGQDQDVYYQCAKLLKKAIQKIKETHSFE